jgi:Protein of unknown function (DUF1579)
MHRIVLAITFVFGLAVAARAAQAPTPPQPPPPAPKPGPEHALFKEDEGTWDAVVEMFVPGQQQPMTSKGVETNTLGCGGLCIITDFKGDMGDMTFHGHGTATWDAAKKKYVGSWTDSMSQGLMLTEGTYDPAKRTFTGWSEAPDATGKVVKSRAVTEYKDKSNRVMSMYMPGPDGKEALGMRITYKKRM